MKIDSRLLIAALGKPQEAAKAWRDFQDEVAIKDYPSELSWAGGYIHFNLLKEGVNDRYLRNIYRYNYLANNYRFAQVLPILKELNSKFDITPIKSFGLSEFEHSLGKRPVGDFDFYIDPQLVDECRLFLAKIGFNPLMNVSEDVFLNQIRPSRGSWNYVNSEMDDLDLHWKLFDHLTEKQNYKIIKNNLIFTNGKFGAFSSLNLELSTVLIGCHHEMSSTLHWGSYFDFIHLIRNVDEKKLIQIAKSAGVLDNMKQLVGLAEDTLNENLISFPKEIKITIPDRRRFFRVTPRKFKEKGLRKRKALYFFWEMLGSYAFLERHLLKGGNTFSLVNKDLLVKEDKNFLIGEGIKLGFGWHYRYPKDKLRWTHYPDARFVVSRKNGNKVRISLDKSSWRNSYTKSFDVFASGNYMGTVDSSQYEITFVLPPSCKDITEISLRRRPGELRKFKGLHSNNMLLMVPVKSIELS